MSAQEKMAAALSTTLQLVKMCSIALCVMSFTFFQSHLCFLVYSGKTNNVHLFPAQAIYAVLHFVLWLNNGTVWMVNTCTYSVCQFRFSPNSLKSFKKSLKEMKSSKRSEERMDIWDRGRWFMVHWPLNVMQWVCLKPFYNQTKYICRR